MALVWITKAQYLENYKVKLTFNDGLIETVDLANSLEGKVFEPLNDISYFKKFKLDSWTLTWPNDSDFAPEYLYNLALKQGRKPVV